jgi:hypothetical protein
VLVRNVMKKLDSSLLVPTHQTNIELSESIPQAIEVGTDIVLRVRVSCSSGCDLRGRPVTLMASDRVVEMSELATYDDQVNETGDLILKAPDDVGEYAWSILFPKCEAEDTVHQESHLRVAFRTQPHTTSMAVWDVPSPVVMHRSFNVKVGVKCSVRCQLTGHLIEVQNAAGTKIGEGRLRETPWPGSTALYWAEVGLAAPVMEEVSSWMATFRAADMSLAHGETSATFSFRTAKPPENRVTIKVTAKEIGVPVEDVEIRLGLYAVFTDDRGLATVEVPSGAYGLTIRKDGYQAQPLTVEVSEDLTVQVEAMTAPTKAETEAEMRRYPGG